MEIDLRWPLFLLCNLLLIALLRMINDVVSLHGVYLSLPALLVLMPALHTPPRWGLLLCFATAIFYAAPYPGSLTPFLIVFGVGYVMFRNFSSQLRRFQRMQILTAIAAVNSLLILCQSLLLSPEIAAGSAYTQRIIGDTLLSALVVYPVGSWFIGLQYGLMSLSGVDPRADAPPQ